MAKVSKTQNMSLRKALTQARLKVLLHYNPETGAWTRALAIRGCRIGDLAGYVDPKGYRILQVDGHNYRSSHLAFLFMSGAFPAAEADHKDCVPGNDRWSNLRHATNAQNKYNTRVSKNCVSGLKGAYPFGDRWRSQIMHNRKAIYLGLFDNAQSAHEAYARKAIELFGEFSRAE